LWLLGGLLRLWLLSGLLFTGLLGVAVVERRVVLVV
jgi:hypothetical protein